MSEENVVIPEAVEPDEPIVEESEDETEDDDDDDGDRVIITSDEFRAHRLDAWEIAFARLFSKDWKGYEVDAADVLILARFIEGDE